MEPLPLFRDSVLAPTSILDSEVQMNSLPADAQARASVDNLKRLLRQGWHCCAGVSFGKDSSLALHLFLTAALEMKRAGESIPESIIVNANTGIENPVIDHYSRSEMEKVRAFVKAHGLPITCKIVTPNLSNNYLVQILGGRTIATLPDGGGQCSVMMKVAPITRFKNRVMKRYGKDQVFTLIGKRLDESTHRRADMMARCESDTEPVRNEAGEYILSPIMNMNLDTVYECLGMVKAEFWPQTYTDFADCLETYRAANAGACELSAWGQNKPSSTGCSARFGCSLCTRVRDDKSMENMLRDDRYSFMEPLNKLRAVILANHYNPSKRNWLGRTCNQNDGTIKISAVAYSPDYCLELLRYVLTIDAEERDAAEALGVPPRFQLLTETDVLAIDFMQNRYGYVSGLVAAREYRDIALRGRRYPLPDNPPIHPKSKFPRSFTLPFSDKEYGSMFAGLRDLDAAIADCEQLVEKPNGRIFSGGAGAEEFAINEESAEFFFGFELETALKRFSAPGTSPTAVVNYLLRFGAVEIYKGSHHEQDRILRIASQIHRFGLRPMLNDPEAIITRLSECQHAKKEKGS